VKFWLRIDDALDVFAEHGIAGMLGLLANGIFGAGYIIGLDGVNTGLYQGGWITHHWKQLYIQFTYICAVTGYTFVVSALLAFIIDKIPGLKLRASEEAELLGMDDDQLGEFAYDYVEVRRDYLAWTPAKQDLNQVNSDVPQGDRHGIQQHSQMLEGKELDGMEPEDNDSQQTRGDQHTGVAGDRHAVAAEEKAEGAARI
jgi:Amt family ammonium transporter